MEFPGKDELKKIMSPELLNRIDDVVVFNPLSRNEISKILDIQIKELENRLADNQITLKIKPKARDYLLDHGYDPTMGARPMRRLIQNEIEEQLSILILQGENEFSKEVIVDLTGDKIKVKFNKPKLSNIKITKEEKIVIN